jgi:hypothetical protein
VSAAHGRDPLAASVTRLRRVVGYLGVLVLALGLAVVVLLALRAVLGHRPSDVAGVLVGAVSALGTLAVLTGVRMRRDRQ